MNIGQRIKEVREELGMQAAVLARRVGVAPNTIYRIEAGDRKPSVALLEKIAGELRTEPADLFREPVPLAEVPQETGLPDLAQRREYAQRLMDAGVSEATAREVSGEFSRSEEYWRALAKYAGLEASEAAPTQAAPAPAEALETSPAAAHDEVVATFPYSPESQAAAFEGALRAAADARSEYDAVLSGEYRLVVRDDGERVEIVLEPLTIDPASQYESLRKRV